MAQDLEKLIISMSADFKAYERALAKAQNTTISGLRKIERDAQAGMGRVEKAFSKAGSVISGFGKGLVLGGITAAVVGIEELVRGSITSAAAIGDLSDKLGISSDKLQELQYGAVQANMGFDELEGGLLKFSKALGQARNGQGDLLTTLEANGFDKAKIKALSYSEALDIVANLVKNAANEQDALLIITQAFGKGGDGFLEFLRGGSAGLEKFAVQAHGTGTVIDKDLIQSAQHFDDAWAAALLHVKSGIGSFVLGVASDLSGLDKSIGGIANRRAAILKAGTRFGTGTPATAPLPPSFAGAGPHLGTGEFLNAPKKTVISDPEVEAEKKRMQALADQRSKNIQKQIGDLQSLFAAVDASNVQQEIAVQLSKYDVDAKSKEGVAITALVEKTMLHKAALETVAFAAQQAAEKQQAFVDSELALADQGIAAFEQWAIEGGKLSDVIADLAKSLLKATIQASLLGQGPLAGLLGTTAGGGFFGSLFNTPKMYAKGGSIGAGNIGIAGEAGPEIIRGPGTVIPLSKMGGGPNVQINVMNYGNDNVDVQRKNGPGGQSFDVIIGQSIDKHFASGRGDRAMGRFAAKPTKARRT